MTVATEKQLNYINSMIEEYINEPTDAQFQLCRTIAKIDDTELPAPVRRKNELEALKTVSIQLGLMKDPTFEWNKQDLKVLLQERASRLQDVRQIVDNGLTVEAASQLINQLKKGIPCEKRDA